MSLRLRCVATAVLLTAPQLGRTAPPGETVAPLVLEEEAESRNASSNGTQRIERHSFGIRLEQVRDKGVWDGICNLWVERLEASVDVNGKRIGRYSSDEYKGDDGLDSDAVRKARMTVSFRNPERPVIDGYPDEVMKMIARHSAGLRAQFAFSFSQVGLESIVSRCVNAKAKTAGVGAQWEQDYDQNDPGLKDICRFVVKAVDGRDVTVRAAGDTAHPDMGHRVPSKDDPSACMSIKSITVQGLKTYDRGTGFLRHLNEIKEIHFSTEIRDEDDGEVRLTGQGLFKFTWRASVDER